MANQTVLSLTVAVLVVIMSSGWVTGEAIVRMDTEEVTGAVGGLCRKLTYVLQLFCGNKTSTNPSKVCQKLALFLKEVCNIPCPIWYCVPFFSCDGTILPFSGCPMFDVCCMTPSSNSSNSSSSGSSNSRNRI